MTTQEAARQAWQDLKGKPLKQKLRHILTYYWVPIFACIVALSIAGSLIYASVTRKDTILFGYCINASPKERAEAFTQDFCAHAQVTDKQEVTLLSNLRTSEYYLQDTLQALTVHTAAQEVDFIATDKDACQTLLRFGYYRNLTDLPEAQKTLLEKYFLYAEKTVLTQDFSSEEATEPVIGSKGDFSEPVPVALRLPEGNRLADAYTFAGKEVVILLIPNSQRTDMVYTFLEYLIK